MRNNKGFTLVELIVVLVILAILAAILVPSMISWIDEANKRSVITTARSVYVGIQAAISEAYGNETLLPADFNNETKHADLIERGLVLAGLSEDESIEVTKLGICTGDDDCPVSRAEVNNLELTIKGVTVRYIENGDVMTWTTDGEFEGGHGGGHGPGPITGDPTPPPYTTGGIPD